MNSNCSNYCEDNFEVRQLQQLPDQRSQPVVDMRVGGEELVQVGMVATKPLILEAERSYCDSLLLQEVDKQLVVVHILWEFSGATSFNTMSIA